MKHYGFPFTIFCVLATVFRHGQANEERWQNCDVFLAPTNTTGWGVFANRDFDKREIIDVTPLAIGVTEEMRELQRLTYLSALHDYTYTVNRPSLNDRASLIMLGPGYAINHHPTSPNVAIGVGSGYAMGWYTRREVKAGEQLFCSYGKKDGGKDWFESRNIELNENPVTQLSQEQLSYLHSTYCSKLYAGPGPSTWSKLIPAIDESRLAPFEAGVGNARLKKSVEPGERIEIVPAMLLYKPWVDGTALEGLTFTIDDLNLEQQSLLNDFAEKYTVRVQYQGKDTNWIGTQRETNWERASIFPYVGSIAMVRRVGKQGMGNQVAKSNCRLAVSVEQGAEGAVIMTLELFATQHMSAGEILLLDLPPIENNSGRDSLKSALVTMGHDFHTEF